jgi:hypothetical protein
MPMKKSRIIAAVETWDKNHKLLTTVFNPTRWGRGDPQFIRELRNIGAPNAGEITTRETLLTPDEELELILALESRTLRDSMSARGTTFQSLVMRHDSNSEQRHRELSEAVELDSLIHPESRAVIRKIMQRLYLQDIKDTKVIKRLLLGDSGKIELEQLHKLSKEIEDHYFQGTLTETVVKELSKGQTRQTPQTPQTGLILNQGQAYWKFATPAAPQKSVAEQKEAQRKYQAFADLGCLKDNGLLSNKLINIFGTRVLSYKRALAELEPSSIPVKHHEMKLSELMVQKIRIMQDIDLFLNQLPEKKKALLEEIASIKSKLDSFEKEPFGSDAKLNALEAKSISVLKAELTQLTKRLGKNDTLQDSRHLNAELIQWQKDAYRHLVQNYQKSQGVLGVRHNGLFENKSNTETTQDAFYAIQEPLINAQVRVTEPMLNRRFQQGEFYVDLDPASVNKPKDAVFAALLVERPDVDMTEMRQIQTHQKQFIKEAEFQKGQYAKIRDPGRKLTQGSPWRMDMFSFFDHQKDIRISDVKNLKVPTKASVEVEDITQAELLRYQRLASRQSAEAIDSDDLISSGTRFLNHFMLIFDEMAAKRPFVMAAAFSVPYMQLGFTGLGLVSHTAFTQHLVHIADLLSAGEAKIATAAAHSIAAPLAKMGIHSHVTTTLAQFNLQPGQIEQVNHLIAEKILWATSAESPIEALITSGFIPAQLIFTVADAVVNGLLSDNKIESTSWAKSTIEGLSQKAIEANLCTEAQAEALAKDALTVAMSLTIATMIGIGLHVMLTGKSKALHLLAEMPAQIANTNPAVFYGPSLSNLVQKFFTIKTAGIIYGKMAMITEEIERAEEAGGEVDKEKIVEKIRNDRIDKYCLKHNIIDGKQIARIKNGDEAEFQVIKPVDAASPEEKDDYADLMLTIGLTQDVQAIISPQTQLQVLKQAQFDESIVNKQTRNPDDRTVMTSDSSDKAIVDYFIKLTSTPNVDTEALTGEIFDASKKRFELIMHQNPHLWSLFSDDRSIKVLKDLKVERIHLTPLERGLRFIGRDLIIRYGLGTLASPIVGLYTAIAGKDKVPWPFRQFMGTTLFPAFYKSLYNLGKSIPYVGLAVLQAVIAPFVAAFDIATSLWNWKADFTATKRILSDIATNIGKIPGVIPLGKALYTAFKAVIHPFSEIGVRLPEILAVAIPSILDTIATGIIPKPLSYIGAGTIALVGGVVGTIGVLVLNGIPALFGKKGVGGKGFGDAFNAMISTVSGPWKAVSEFWHGRFRRGGVLASMHNATVTMREGLQMKAREGRYFVKDQVGDALAAGRAILNAAEYHLQEPAPQNSSTASMALTLAGKDAHGAEKGLQRAMSSSESQTTHHAGTHPQIIPNATAANDAMHGEQLPGSDVHPQL